MKSMKLVAALVLGLSSPAALASSPVMADAAKTHKMKDHCKMDMAGMSAAETKAMVDKMFQSIDVSKDGLLSKDEFAKHHEQMNDKHQHDQQDKAGHDHRATHKGG